jgi:hypothetical protein
VAEGDVGNTAAGELSNILPDLGRFGAEVKAALHAVDQGDPPPSKDLLKLCGVVGEAGAATVVSVDVALHVLQAAQEPRKGPVNGRLTRHQQPERQRAGRSDGRKCRCMTAGRPVPLGEPPQSRRPSRGGSELIECGVQNGERNPDTALLQQRNTDARLVAVWKEVPAVPAGVCDQQAFKSIRGLVPERP